MAVNGDEASSLDGKQPGGGTCVVRPSIFPISSGPIEVPLSVNCGVGLSSTPAELAENGSGDLEHCRWEVWC